MTGFAKNMMRTAAVALCGAALALPAMAQGGQDQQGPPRGGGGMGRGGGAQRLEMMQKELNLTPEQTEKVKAILADGRTQMMALRDGNDSQEDRREKMMKVMRAENDKVKAVLDADQKKKFEVMQQKQMERMRERRGGAGQGGNGAGSSGGDMPPPPPQQQ